MEEHNNNELLQRFLTYVAFDTQSKSSAKHSPSSPGQMKLALHLQQELIELGLQDVSVTKHAVVTAYLPSNHPDLTQTIGFISHLDTSPQCSGKNVQPEVIENYRGGDIALGLGEEFISPVYYPFLHQLIGKTLIVTDGTTLLGADNKAGIAEIMTALSVLQRENISHCNIRVAFTPDEEIGLGMHYFPLEDHPGYAKNKLVNALTLACEFQQGFPKDDVPEKTSGKEGFFHLDDFKGDIEKVELHYLIRDFDQAKFEQRKAFIYQLVEKFNREKSLKDPVECVIEDSYKNMYDTVKNVPQAIKLADAAMKACGITPNHKPIRGGTDGAFLAEKGLACPNIFTGGYNFHSKHELVTLEGMEKAVEVVIKIANCKDL